MESRIKFIESMTVHGCVDIIHNGQYIGDIVSNVVYLDFPVEWQVLRKIADFCEQQTKENL